MDLFYFMAGQLESVQATPSVTARVAWASDLSRTWATLPAEIRKAIVATPVTWALTLAGWTEMTPAAREKIKGAYAQLDIVKGLRSDFVAARNHVSPAAPSYSSARQQVGGNAPAPLPMPWAREGGNVAASRPTPPQGRDSVDVSAEIAKVNRSYDVSTSLSNSGFNSTMNLMSAMKNMSGPR